MLRLLTIPLALTLFVGSVHAVVLPDDVQAALDQRYDTFVGEPGFEEVASFPWLEDWNSSARFPNRDPDAYEFARPDAGINAATKALMVLQSQEPALPHVRYRITYRLDNAPDFGGYPNAYVEVTRFNLGPVRRADTVASTPDGVPVAPAEYFGVGPSVSWRFVMGWHQSSAADVVRASRRVLTTAQAEAMDCLGAPCMAMASSRGPDGKWQEATPPTPRFATYVATKDGSSTAAHISELLYRQASAGQDRVEALPMHDATPQLTFVISMNVEGQDTVADGLLHQQLLQDDAVSDIWTRRREAGVDTVDWQQYFEHYPGRN